MLVVRMEGLAPVERAVAEIVYSQGGASAADICRLLPRPIGNSAVRSMLARLDAKGVVRRRRQGKKFIYLPAVSDEAVRAAALRRLAEDHFGGSPSAMARAVEVWASREAKEGRRRREGLPRHDTNATNAGNLPRSQSWGDGAASRHQRLSPGG